MSDRHADTRAPTHTLFLVPSAGHAVQGETVLIREGIPCRLVPVPRHLSSQCGVCLMVQIGDGDRAKGVLDTAGVRTEGTHEV